MKLQVRSRTLGSKGKESSTGAWEQAVKQPGENAPALGIVAADIQLLESAGICRCLYHRRKEAHGKIERFHYPAWGEAFP